jgi:hypothetical protein
MKSNEMVMEMMMKVLSEGFPLGICLEGIELSETKPSGPDGKFLSGVLRASIERSFSSLEIKSNVECRTCYQLLTCEEDDQFTSTSYEKPNYT